MRLLYLSADPGVPVFGGKGASVHLRALVGALHGLGHEVLVASPRLEAGENQLPEGVLKAEVPAVRPRECRSPEEVQERCQEQAAAVVRLMADHRLEGIYERYSLMGVAGARAAVELAVPLVLEVNAPLREEERRYRHLVHEDLALAAERESFAAARRIFTVSTALRGWLVGEGVDPGKVEVMPNSPPGRPFTAAPARGERPEMVVGFAGGLKLWHGIGTLVEGFRLAREAGGRMRLEIVGRGPADELVDGAGLPEGALRRLGALPHEQALQVVETWDVGVAPFSAVPDFYFSPLKLYEYMAAGVCPVVTDVGELAAIVRDGSAGVVVAPDDPEALATALLELDRDRDRLRELAARAQRAARELPTWRHSAQRVVAALTGTPAAAGSRAEVVA